MLVKNAETRALTGLETVGRETSDYDSRVCLGRALDWVVLMSQMCVEETSFASVVFERKNQRCLT